MTLVQLGQHTSAQIFCHSGTIEPRLFRRYKAMQIARQLLDVLDVETISQKTGLSVAEIQQLSGNA